MKNRPIPKISEEDRTRIRGLVIYEDAFLLAFNKPSGLAVQTRGNRGTSLDHLLWTFARSNGKRPRLVHRIDAGTSGLVLAAKTKPAAAFLSTEFAERRVSKRYLALVGGTLPRAERGVCEEPLLQTDRRVRISSLEKGADAARTDWRILKRSGQFGLIEARPKTGRMHQIRAHLASMGCPILGDPIYGGDAEAAARLMLHAAGLGFRLPNSENLVLDAPVPGDFIARQATLGL